MGMTKPRRSLYQKFLGRWRQWRFKPHMIDREVAGERISFYIADLFGEGWYGPTHHFWPELQWIKDCGIRLGDTVVDCGANHGFSTVLFGRWAGTAGTVVAFEPLPHNVGILRRNLEINRIANVKLRNVAIGEEDGIVEITTHSNGTILKGGVSLGATTQVPVRRLDDEMSGLKVDFIKIDVEGYELKVLRGARRLLQGFPRMDIELHVFLYSDKVKELAEIFSLLPLKEMRPEIQLLVDGPIVSMNLEIHTPVNLAKLEVVHLFIS